MAPPPPSTSDEHPLPRRTLKSTLIAGTVALLPLWLVGLVAGIQDFSTRTLPRARPVAAASAQSPAPRGNPVAAPDAAATPPLRSPTTTMPPPARIELPTEAAETPAPQAGRQVLRCTERGRVTYRDLQSACPEGVGEAVTVFPTQGVEKFR